MNILFIHQNFPGQFKNLAPALAARGDKCVALTLRVKKPADWKGVRVLPYSIKRKPSETVHPWLVDLNTKLHRAEACMAAAFELKDLCVTIWDSDVDRYLVLFCEISWGS